jgi:hypothetical protein
MNDEIISPDGDFKWNGSEWIPLIPKLSQSISINDSVIDGDIILTINTREAIAQAMKTLLDAIGNNTEGADDSFQPTLFDELTNEEISKDIKEYFEMKYPSVPPVEWKHLISDYWKQFGWDSDSDHQLISSQIKKRMNQIQYDVSKEIMREYRIAVANAKDEIPRVVEQCVAWTLNSGLKRINKQKVLLYLEEEKLYWKHRGHIDLIHAKANLILKTKH